MRKKCAQAVESLSPTLVKQSLLMHFLPQLKFLVELVLHTSTYLYLSFYQCFSRLINRLFYLFYTISTGPTITTIYIKEMK